VTARVEVVVSRKMPGVVFANWEAKWADVARETVSLDLAAGQQVNLLQQVAQKVPVGGRVRWTVVEPKSAPLMEEFIANVPAETKK
jgi:hypothetical protein